MVKISDKEHVRKKGPGQGLKRRNPKRSRTPRSSYNVYPRTAVQKKYFNYLMKKAREDKKWAEEKKGDIAWRRRASEVSNKMLDNRLSKTSRELALDSYRYRMMRLSLETERGRAIAPDWRREWQNVTGEPYRGKKRIY